MSTDLLSCLQAQKWHTLRGLARANNLPFDSNLTAAQAAKHLHANLGQDNFFPTLWPALSSEAQAALLALQEAGGCLPREDFIHRFGPVRPYKPWRSDAPPPVWETPQSPAEEIVYRGLAFFVNLGATQRPAWAAILPDEFHTPLSALASAPLLSLSALPLPFLCSLTCLPSSASSIAKIYNPSGAAGCLPLPCAL